MRLRTRSKITAGVVLHFETGHEPVSPLADLGDDPFQHLTATVALAAVLGAVVAEFRGKQRSPVWAEDAFVEHPIQPTGQGVLANEDAAGMIRRPQRADPRSQAI